MSDTWLILGASSAIARAFARVAAIRGADVLLAARDIDDAGATAVDIAIRTGRRAEVVAFDATDEAAHAALVERARAFAGEGTLNVFLAFGAMPEQSAIDADPMLVGPTIAANFTSAAVLLHRLAPVLEARGAGAVVALGSVAGDRGRLKNYVYGSAKAGLHAYLQGLRARLVRKGVHVVTLKPGFVDTAMTWGLPGMFLVASPETIAAAALDAATRKRDIVYAPGFWWGIMTIIRHIPERIFKKLNI
ncbi:MAG: SDR family NAD(P)-dependent oxidoreductase [Alphaproteobacteria bacterium]|nr:SDR family NAD(P)-dependent oxidoreductase [Alphaproteobacteria bacterium]